MAEIVSQDYTLVPTISKPPKVRLLPEKGIAVAITSTILSTASAHVPTQVLQKRRPHPVIAPILSDRQPKRSDGRQAYHQDQGVQTDVPSQLDDLLQHLVNIPHLYANNLQKKAQQRSVFLLDACAFLASSSQSECEDEISDYVQILKRARDREDQVSGDHLDELAARYDYRLQKRQGKQPMNVENAESSMGSSRRIENISMAISGTASSFSRSRLQFPSSEF
jgi:hypothetical protein